MNTGYCREMADRPPAPEPLEVIRALVNTREPEEEADSLDSPAAARQFLVEHELASKGVRVSAEDLERLRETREALRSMLVANNGGEVAPAAVATLNRLADQTALGARFSTDGTLGLAPRGGGVDAALAAILAIVFEAVAHDTWSRLKACKDEDCQWAFYDRSRNRSSQWCVMAVCGNRNKARTFRERQRREDAR